MSGGVRGGGSLASGREEETALEDSAIDMDIDMGGLPAKQRRSLRWRFSPSPRGGTTISRSHGKASARHSDVAAFYIDTDSVLTNRRSRATPSRLASGVWSIHQHEVGATGSMSAATTPLSPGFPARDNSGASQTSTRKGLRKALPEPALLNL